MEFRILGPLEVREDGEQVPLGGGKLGALLALLLLNANETVSSERLIDELWGDRPPETATKALHYYVSRLRTVLDPTREPGSSNGLIATHGSGYELSVDEAELDLLRFRRMVDQARTTFAAGESAAASDELRDALRLWRGTPLADLSAEPFARAAIPRLEELRLAAIEDWIDMELALGRHTRLVSELDTLVTEHPYRERLRTQLMLALYRSGRQAEALAVYDRTRRMLVDELGIEPGSELQRLQRAILAQDPALEPGEAHTSAQPAASPARPPGRRRRRFALAAAGVVAAAVAGAALWLSGGGGDGIVAYSVVAIDPRTLEILRSLDVGDQPHGVVTEASAAWIGVLADRSVARVDSRTLDVVARIAIPATPDVLTAGAGKVWVGGREGALFAIDPARNRAEPWSAEGDAISAVLTPAEPIAGTVAVDGDAVWLGVEQVRTVWRADLDTTRVAQTIHGVAARLIVPTQDGAWVLGASGALFRIDSGSGTAQRVPFGGKAADVAVGGGGVWLLDYKKQRLVRVDPSTREVNRAIGLEPLGPADRLAFGAGSLWVTQHESGRLLRIDAATLSLGERIELGYVVDDVAEGAGRVWVTIGEEIGADSG